MTPEETYLQSLSDYDPAEFRRCYGDEGVHWMKAEKERQP